MFAEVPCPVIGLLGGIAAGKSWVAAQLAQWGAGVLDADQAGHEVLQQPEVLQAIAQRWPQVLTPQGQVDRKKLAQTVFSSPKDREHLEAITHPRIAQRLRQQAQQLCRQGAVALVLDAPLLMESGWDRWCDWLLFVDAPEQVRLQRAMQRGWSAEEFHRREQAQAPLEQKRQRAHAVVDNSASPQHTRKQLLRLWKQWIASQVPSPENT